MFRWLVKSGTKGRGDDWLANQSDYGSLWDQGAVITPQVESTYSLFRLVIKIVWHKEDYDSWVPKELGSLAQVLEET